MTLDEAIEVCAKRNPLPNEADALVAAVSVAPDDALNALAVDIARRYMAGTVSFDVADAVMNALYSHAARTLQRMPEPMCSIFDAFDSGEYHHRGDADGTDPEQKYTRPQLAEILSNADVA